MINAIQSWLRFYRDAITIYSVHSPFVYDFMLDVLDTSKMFYSFGNIEKERKELLKNHQLITFEDHGAGSKINNKHQRKISEIAKNSLSTEHQCRLLFNIADKYQPSNIIELGTSLGISTLYLSKAKKKAMIHTIEGNPSSANFAAQLLNKHNCDNIKLYQGTFDQWLPQILEEVKEVGIIYVDGNHKYEATMHYFSNILPYCNQQSILIFDDIYWSEGMEKAWAEIKSNPKVSLTIDLYDVGLVFFHEEREKQHFKLLQWWKKPWNIGLWG